VTPEIRFVLYQNAPETKQVELFTESGPDLIPAGAPITLYARRPGTSAIAFTVECTAVGNLLSIPFDAIALSTAGNFDYAIVVEVPEVAPALKLSGVVRHGTGLEIVAVPGAA
jgi:hypothetical protein